MHVAYLSPLPPVRSGVSEYSVDLLPHLARHLQVTAFTPEPASTEVAGVPLRSLDDLDGAGVDLAIYHMGNNVHHRFVDARARRHPGLLVLHDLVLHHLHIEDTLALGDPERYVRGLAEVYGETGWSMGLARAHGASSDLGYFLLPMFEPVALASRGVLVHNRRAARIIEERIVGLPVAVVGMGIPSPQRDPLPDRAGARRQLGIGEGSLVIGMFGFTTPIKRPHMVLRSLAAAGRRRPAARLVIVGEVSPGLELEREARELGIADRVRLTGYLPYDEVKAWIAAIDVFANLRYPTAGETSASLLRLLGWGKSVIVSDYGQFRELPEEVAPRVAVGASEVEELAALIELFASSPEIGAAFGAASRRFVAREHTMARAAAGYAEFARELVAGPAPRPRLRSPRWDRSSRTPGFPRVELEAGPLPAVATPGGRLALRVDLRNLGDTTLLRGPRLGGGDAVLGGYVRRPWGGGVGELGWASLDGDLPPGAATAIDYRFELPDVEGPVELLIDVKIPGWGFLHRRGSRALRYPIELSRRA